MNRWPQIARTSALLFAALALCAAAATAYTGDHAKMQVRLAWPMPTQAEALQQIPDLDPMKVVPGEEIILVSHAAQVERLEALGFEVDVLIADMEEHYAAQRDGYRNFGDLYTYSEMVGHINQIHADYPEITTAPFSIGTTHEGNTIWAIKLSDNPDVDENEPEVLFDALHHAREPITVNVLVETLRELCEGYGTDAELTFLVDNREIFFVPVINVDGYLYNEQTYPGGGGMWRKNRRDNEGSSCYGVDPNRNYPYMWNQGGSSSDPCSETYHGPEPGSEPCVQALMAFCNEHEFVTHDSYHSVAGMVLIPWSYTNSHTPDDAVLRAMANTMAQWCGYQVGQAGEILYNCSGTTTDWAYGEQTSKPKIYSFCTEVDGSGFWPTDGEVPGLVGENIPKNLYLIQAAGAYPDLADGVLSGGDGDGLPDPGETLDFVVTLENQSQIADAENVSVTLSTADPYVQLHQATADLGTIPAGAQASHAGSPFSFTLSGTCPVGHFLNVEVRVIADAFDVTYDWSWTVGDLPTLFADDIESGGEDWTHAIVTPGFADDWHQTTQRNHTPGGATSWKFGAVASGDYSNLADGALETLPITLSGRSSVKLTFWHWMAAEESSSYPGRAYDGGLIEVAIDGGAWTQVTPVDGYTHTVREGGTPGPFPENTPIFSGSFDWRRDEVALDGTWPPGTEVAFRFRFGSDGAATDEGWYVDDVAVVGMAVDNLPPGAPALASPAYGATVVTAMPELTVTNASDPDPGDELDYGFRVYTDALLTDPVATVASVPEGAGTTSWQVTPALGDGTYYWTAYADDGTEAGPCMSAGMFLVEAGGASVADRPLAGGLRLLAPAPNPAPGQVWLRFELAAPARVSGEVFDLAGRRVRRLEARAGRGRQALYWDGRDQVGHPVPAGVYLYRLDGRDELGGRLLIVR